MNSMLFYRLGRLIYPLRWWIITLWILIIVACIPVLPNIISPFKTTGFMDEHSKSAKTQQYINKKLGYSADNKFIILYTSHHLLATNPLFMKKITYSLSGLKHFPLPHEIIIPEKEGISKDKHTRYVVVILKEQHPVSDQILAEFKTSIRTPHQMTVQLGGEAIFIEAVNKQTQEDLFKADFIATPVAIITMVLVFGSLIAAILPIFLGGGCALIILTSLFFIGHAFTLSIFTLNIALLLGLCLSLDYALFVICRFRDELALGKPIQEAIAETEATAGKAIFFSGLAVFVSLSALLFFPINILFSVAVGGLAAVFVAVLTAIVLLPALLSVLNTKINLLPVRLRRQSTLLSPKNSIWHAIAERVVHHPWLFFIPILLFLILLGCPLTTAQYGISDFRIFPEHSSNRAFFDNYAEQYDERELSPISILVQTSNSNILSTKNLSHIIRLAKQLKNNPPILEVNGIVPFNPKIPKAQLIALYQMPKKQRTPELKTLLATTTGKHFTVLSVVGKNELNSPKTEQLVRSLGERTHYHGLTLSLTGTPVNNMDVLHSIAHTLPYAMLWIMIMTYLILLVLLRSLILPLKAIIMTLLSLSACYGALVLVFQEGYLHHILNFETQGMLDISLLVIIFCALFGFSMDYEVFLLTRLKESYDLTKDNKQSIVFGIEKSSRIITSAALIVIFICSSFLIADVLMVKAFGLGIAVAIFVDAFLIRTFLVPATMTLLNEWNWYLPKWLDRLLPKI